MPYVIGAIVIGLLVLAIAYWWVTLTVAVVGFLIYWQHKASKEEEERKKREEEATQRREAAEEASRRAEEADRQRLAREQQHHHDQITKNDESALATFEVLPTQLSSAEDRLDQALLDFKERAFAPFWDSIEASVTLLAQFDRGVQHIRSSAARHLELASLCQEPPAGFPLSRDAIARVPIGTETSKRLQAIVRQAQRDFQFASIFEQRKTNQILSSGFRSLAHAISDMTIQLTGSIDSLSTSIDHVATSIDRMGSNVHESVKSLQQHVQAGNDASELHYKERMRYAKHSAARQDRAIAMLDNIQRRRRPVL